MGLEAASPSVFFCRPPGGESLGSMPYPGKISREAQLSSLVGRLTDFDLCWKRELSSSLQVHCAMGAKNRQ